MAEDLKKAVEQEYDKAQRLQGERDGIEKQLKELKEEARWNKAKVDQLIAITKVFENLVSRQQQETRDLVEKFVSRGLQEIYKDDSYQFRIEVEQQSAGGGTRRPIARFKVGHIMGDREVWAEVRKAQGTGVAEVVGLLLQIAMVASQEDLAQLVVLDDPIGRLDPERTERAADLIQDMSKEMQFIITTTNPNLAAVGDKRGNRRYRLQEKDGKVTIQT